ncbi:hypothetical protein J1N35_006775 [Gossypium stocksii]|uniref:AP complex subunit sigma n=1 Tax=Gossypium stocksii TaxID=47602 RepID=A0A9D4ACU6_9ROSI|nr:hypothetical protein J1N35_006775 [Gossypium stocksii]
MIKAVMVMNTQGKPRLAKFFDFLFVLGFLFFAFDFEFDLLTVLCSRPENVSNFIEAESIFGPDSRLVYNHFATLYFVVVFDSSENELAMLDLIQFLVQQTLERCFKNVSSITVIQIHTILDEIILGGQVLETRSTEILRAAEEISKLEAATIAISFIPKSASSWLSR